MKDSGLIISSTEKDMKNFLMEQFTQELMLTENHKAMEHIHGRMVKHMKDNGLTEIRTVLVSGEVPMVIPI